MGLTDFPYQECQEVTWDKDVELGNRQDMQNPLEWLRVVFTPPGTPTYNYCRPWVYKESSYGSIAADLFVYVDDGLPIGPTQEV